MRQEELNDRNKKREATSQARTMGIFFELVKKRATCGGDLDRRLVRDMNCGLRDTASLRFWLGASAILSLGIGVNVAAFQLLTPFFGSRRHTTTIFSRALFVGEFVESFSYRRRNSSKRNNGVFSRHGPVGFHVI